MRLLPAAVAMAAALVGCGGSTGGAPPRTGGAGSEGERVVRAWADAVRAGRFADAAATFAVPAVVANGGPRMRLRTRTQVDLFNRSLPCGAVLEGTRPAGAGRFVGRFRLTERRGPGSACGSGVGATADVAFRVRDGRILEWLRVLPREGGGDRGRLV